MLLAEILAALLAVSLAKSQVLTNEIAKPVFDVDAWQVGKGPSAVSSLEGSCFAAYWDDLPSLIDSKDDEEVVVLKLDGHSFSGRMSAIKFLLYSVDQKCLWERSSTTSNHREWHWLWAYGCQIDWQQRSGRFDLNRSTPSDQISTRSWWSYKNFCFSLAILFGFEKSGLLQEAFGGKTVLIELDEESKALLKHDGVQKSILAWENLFRNGYSEFRNKVLGSQKDLSDTEYRDLRFQFQQQVWQAHSTVITVTEDTHSKELLNLLPEAERKFGLGWASMVEILAAANFPTDLLTLQQDGAGFLPLQVMTDTVWAQWEEGELSTLEQRRFRAAKVTHELVATPAPSLHRMASFWKRVVHNEHISRSMPGTVNDLVHGKISTKLRQLGRVLWLFVRPRRNVEWAAEL